MTLKKIKFHLRTVYLLITVLMVGCTSFRQGNFNTQKHTKLKPIETRSIENEDEKIKSNAEPLENNYSELLLDEKKENQNLADEISVEHIDDKNQSIDKEEKSSNSLVLNLEVNETEKQEEIIIGNRRDLEMYSDDVKQQAIIDFNRIFNSGLIVLLIGFLLIGLGLIYFNLIIGLIGGGFVFFAWIMSFIATHKLEEIAFANQPKNIRIKFILTCIVKFVGVAVCIVTIVGGLILLVLWALNVI